MKENILIVGIGGSLGGSLYAYYQQQSQYNVWGTTTQAQHAHEQVVQVDFTNISSIEQIPDIPIHHVIITSGYEPQSNLSEMTHAHVQKMFDVHVIGPMMCLKKIQPQLCAASSVTLISSPAAWQGSYDPAYAAVKGAVNALVRTLAKDMAPNTRVNAFSPSVIESSTVFNRMTDDFKQRHIDRTLNKRLLTLDECVQAIDFIIKSPHYTGQILHLNGGMIYG